MKSVIASGLTLVATCAALSAHAEVAVVNQAISEAEVQAAQQGWCNALVEISATHVKSGQPAAKALAEK
jgi:hypothetical protein